MELVIASRLCRRIYVRAHSQSIERTQIMARKTVLVSDLSGKEIHERDAAKLTITYADARRGQVVLDVIAAEVDDLASKGTKQGRRGRKPKQ